MNFYEEMQLVEVFPWNPNFEMGIPEIDEQHKNLVRLVNDLAGHLAFKSDLLTLNSIFKELTDYASYHFETEEKIWQNKFNNDEWIILHQNEHNAFIDEINKFTKEQSNFKPVELLENILSYLTHWLAFHILDSDKRMSKVLLAMEGGKSLVDAKSSAENEMNGAIRILIDTILTMYDSLSARTLDLMREIKERRKAEAKLRLAANAFENTLDEICITDTEIKIIEANPSFYKITDSNMEDVLGHELSELKTGIKDKRNIPGFWETFTELGHWSGIIRNRRKSGEIEDEWLTLSTIKSPNGQISNYVAVFSNISHLIEQQNVLERMAHHDELTGLPNRFLLKDRLSFGLAHSERTKTFLAICYIDLDGFKPVNDEYGHAVGDLVLMEIAHRFRKIVRGNDTVARLGGDEFIILLGDLKNKTDYIRVLEKILIETNREFQINKTSNVKLSASIGVTIFPDDKGEVDELLHHADLAMYEAKKLGKNQYCLFEL